MNRPLPPPTLVPVPVARCGRIAYSGWSGAVVRGLAVRV